MKKIILVFLLPINAFCQQWYSLGLLDSVGTLNGNKVVNGITFYNNKITIGGNFKKENNTVLNGVAQWGGTNWNPMGIGVWWGGGASIDSTGNGGNGLVMYKNNFYAAGAMTGAGGVYVDDPIHIVGNIARWTGNDWFPLAPSVAFSGFNNGCSVLQVYHNNLYAGGAFSGSWDATGSHATEAISRWNDTMFSACGQMSGDFPPNSDDFVMDFTIYQNKLIAGGYFTAIDGSPYGTYSGIAAYDDTNWSALGVGFNNAVYALTVYNGELYAGGEFTATRDNLTPLNHIAKWNGTQWSAVGEGLNDTVYTLTVDSVNNKLYAGGGFTQTGLGVPAKHLAQWTGTNWQEVGGGTNRTVRALFSKDGNLYVGGFFTYVNDTMEAHLIACWGYGLNVGGNELEVSSSKFQVVPNPNNGEFYLNLNKEFKDVKIEIRDVVGRLVYKEEIKNTSQTPIKLDAMAGIYFMSIVADDGSTSSPQVRMNGKIIKQ